MGGLDTRKESPIRSIVKHTDPALKTVCDPVPEGYDLEGLMHELTRAMRYPAGIGLAAPQIGELVRVIVVRVPHGYQDLLHEVANPEIYWTGEGERQDWEGCLSFPTGYRALVPRHRRIKVRGINRYFEPIQFGARNLLARCLQHEIDHLDGILMVDKATRTDQRKKQEVS